MWLIIDMALDVCQCQLESRLVPTIHQFAEKFPTNRGICER